MPTPATILFFIPISLLVLAIQYTSSGIGLLSRSPIKFSSLEKIVLGTLLSISIQAVIIFLVGQLIGTSAYWLSYLFLLFGVLSLPQLYTTAKESIGSIFRHPSLTILMLVCILSLASTLAFSWIKLPQGFRIQAGQLHDSSWHIALINNLQHSIPPEHPSSSSLVVQQYHYFYDISIAALSATYHLPATVLYFQVFPFVLAFLLAGSCVMLAQRLQPRSAGLLLFLTFFGGSLAYVTPLFIPGIVWHESMFWVSQTFATMGNPQMIFSLATMVTVIWLIQLLIQMKFHQTGKKTTSFQKSWWLHAFILTLIVSSFGFKSYGWLVMGSMYGPYLLFECFERYSLRPLGWGVVLGLLSLPLVGMITGFSTSSFFFFPLWYLTSMVESLDRLNIPHWRIMEDQARLDGNVLGVLKIQTIEFVIFWIGNLGTRVIWCLLPILVLFRQLKLTRLTMIIGAGLTFSAAFPLLFLQRGAVWNSIQFWYYALILANIFTTWVMIWLWKTTDKIGRARYAFVAVFLLLSVPTYFPTQQIKLTQFEGISADQTAFLESLGSESHVLICPSGNAVFKTALVSAGSGAHIYIANTAQLAITDQNPEEVEKQIGELFNAQQTSQLTQILKEKAISHILCDDTNKEAQIAAAVQNFPKSQTQKIDSWQVTEISQ